MKIEAAARSDVGLRRAANEDSFALQPELGLYLVADGMGGHVAGQIASQLAVEACVEALRTPSEGDAGLSERLRLGVLAANHQIFSTAQAKPELAGMGTTVVALLAGEQRIALAHVGDSRAYRVRAGAIEQLSGDHSLVAEMIRRGDLDPADAETHPHRHVLTRALGVQRSVEVEVAEPAFSEGDVLVLCSDGLTLHVADEEIAETVAGEGDLDAACAQLVERALSRGGEDNVTVALLRHA